MNSLLCSIIFLTVVFSGANSQEKEEGELQIEIESNTTEIIYEPETLINSIADKIYQVEWYTTFPEAHHASVEVSDSMVASILEFQQNFGLDPTEENITGRGSLNVSADFVGFNDISITIYDINNETLGNKTLKMTVLLSYGRLNLIFTYILTVFIFIIYINMGATLDFSVVKQIAKKPIGPAVGIICQYGFMPLIAFALAKLVFAGNELRQLGMFLNGASPGGGGSNIWTYLLGGSLDLSIMMTFFSTLVAFGAVPLWVLTMGPQIIGSNSSISIPYDQIAIMVISLVIPCCIGLLIQRYFPKIAKFMETRILPVFAVVNIIFISTVGIYSHRYVFALFNARLVFACFGLPSLGYLSGFLMSTLTRRSKKETIAISIETGIQNATIPIVILKLTLGHPAGDLAVVVPACTVFMTPILPLCAFSIKVIYTFLTRTGSKDILTPIEDGKKPGDSGVINPIAMPEINGKDQEQVIPKAITSQDDSKLQNGFTYSNENSKMARSEHINGVTSYAKYPDLNNGVGRPNGTVPHEAQPKNNGCPNSKPSDETEGKRDSIDTSSSNTAAVDSQSMVNVPESSETSKKSGIYGIDNPAVDLTNEDL